MKIYDKAGNIPLSLSQLLMINDKMWREVFIYNSGLLVQLLNRVTRANKPEGVYPNARIRSKSFSSPTTHRTSPACRQREGVMSVRFC